MNEREKITLSKMIRIYCRSVHKTKKDVCTECKKLELYAHQRLEHCHFGENKPVCKKCTIHCYKPEYRQKIRQIMRFSGPRMIIYYPLDSIKHLIHNKKK